MALTLASSGASAWNSATSPKDVTISWAAGDIIVVKAVTEQGGTTISTPTATGLTFTQRATEGSASGTECNAYIFTATAAASGSSVTLSVARAGSSGFFGYQYNIWSGASGVTGGTGNVNESTTNMTTAAGDAVEFILGDFNATTPFTRAPATGSGTATEEVETFATQMSVYAARWEGCSAGSNAYGITSYTGLAAASAFLVITAAATAAASAPRRRSPKHHLITR